MESDSLVAQFLQMAPSLALRAIKGWNDERRSRFTKELTHLVDIQANDRYVSDIRLFSFASNIAGKGHDLIGSRAASEILTSCAFYQSNIGNSARGKQVAECAVRLAYNQQDLNIRRRAHVSLALNAVAIYDFGIACHQIQSALEIARELNNPVFECAAINNIAHILLSMGMYKDALSAVFVGMEYRISTAVGKALQMSNAMAGMRCGLALRDRSIMTKYFIIANKKDLRTNAILPSLSKAYFEYYRATYLIDTGNVGAAEQYIDSAFSIWKDRKNVRVSLVLRTARALCDHASGVHLRMAEAKRTLQAMLGTSSKFPLHYEDTVRALMTIGATDNNPQQEADARRLQEYLGAFRQAKFHLHLARHKSSAGTNGSHDSDVDLLPRLAKDTMASVDSKREKRFQKPRKKRCNVVEEQIKLFEGVANELRSEAFDVAENWAVAAEYSVGSLGHRCFRIGRLSGLIAWSIGKSEYEQARIELATRLHDIGKIAIQNESARENKFDALTDIRCKEHTVMGFRFLSVSDDAVLRLGAIVARHHHEWWNGCGYPDRLRGEEIPVEARICAIADTYEGLTNRGRDQGSWSHRAAIKQIVAMGGVQLDPNLINPFLKAVEKYAGEQERVSEAVDLSMERNQLAHAKKKLFETLELVD